MKNYLEQLLAIWKQFGPSQKVSILLSCGAISAVMVALVVWASKPKMQLLYGGLSSDDMSQVVGVLEGDGVSFQLGSGGTSIFVPADKVYSIRMTLASQGVPSGGTVGFEIFDETNFGISDFVQKTNYARAIQGELSRTIAQLQGVRSARVMISAPENRLIAKSANVRPTASVFVDTGGSQISDDAVNSIQFLVANSVEGLKIEDVAVVDNHGNALSEAMRGDSVAGGGAGKLKYRQSLEHYYGKKIENMLERIVGKGNVVAQVAVSLSSDASTIVEEKFDPTGQVIRSQQVTEDNSLKDGSKPLQVGGITGAGTGGEGDFGNVSQATNSSKDVTKKKSIAYEISKSRTETVKGPGGLEDISAAVFIVMQQKVQEGSAKPVADPRADVELKELRQMIAHAVGIKGDDNLIKEKISLKEVPFVQEKTVATANLFEVPPGVFQIVDILKSFSGLGMALLMFFVFFKMVKSHSPSKPSVEFLEGKFNDQIEEARNVTPKPTADLINELIKQKPDNVGTALKNWMNSE